ncbi:MAG: M48 family metallopeptidase [Candidatus Binatia bacterium]|jgi:beta-barrel assembly-enhancing protease
MKRAVLVLLSLLTAGCFRTTGLNRYQPNMYSVGNEIGMGQAMSKEVEKEMALVRLHRLTQLVQGIGQRLAENAESPEFKLYPYTFKVVDSSEVNAFSLPGGPVYVNLGLVELAETEDELAAVIAHEMGHVAARHATEQMTTQDLTQLALMVTLSTVGLPPLAIEGTRLGYVLGMLRYSRGMETEADRLSLELLKSAGFDPHAMATMLQHIQDERRVEPMLLERLMSSHPLPDDRVEAVEAELPKEPEDRMSHPASAPFERLKVLLVKD